MKRLLPILSVFLAGSVWAAKAPKWVNGSDPAYPETAYVIGVGVGNDLDGARDNARAEISRTFQARIQQTMTDTQTEASSSVDLHRSEALGTQKSEMTTKVITDYLLEGVRIPETWFDKKKNKHYALAILDRRAARESLSNQITEKEESISTRLTQLEDATSPLAKAKALGQALKVAQERDALVARRRVVDSSPIPDLANGSSTAEIDGKLNQVLTKIEFGVQAQAGKDSRLKESVSSRVTELGFKISDAPDAPLILKCDLSVKPFDRGHPQWKFYHWEGSVQLLDGGKVVASSTPSGEEGHLVESTAESKARTAGEQGEALEAQKLVSQYVFGQ